MYTEEHARAVMAAFNAKYEYCELVALPVHIVDNTWHGVAIVGSALCRIELTATEVRR